VRSHLVVSLLVNLSYLIGLSNLGSLLRHVRIVGLICHGVCVVVGFISINSFVLLLPLFLVLLVLLVVLSPLLLATLVDNLILLLVLRFRRKRRFLRRFRRCDCADWWTVG
jgi:hypothetical protein